LNCKKINTNTSKSDTSKVKIYDIFGYWKVIEKGIVTKRSERGSWVCLCLGCNKVTKKITTNILTKGRSKSCGCKSKEILKETNNSKYGVDNVFQSEQFKDKIKETNLEKYGSTHPKYVESLQQKVKETNLKKYGSTSPFGSDLIKQKIKNKIKEKYKVNHPAQNSTIRQKMKNTCIEKYGVDNYAKTEESKEKIKKTTLEKYGVESYSKTEECRQKIKNTCIEKYGVDSPQKNPIVREKIKQTRIKNKKKGIFPETPSAIVLKDGKKLSDLYRQYNINSSHLIKLYKLYGEDFVYQFCEQFPQKSDVEVLSLSILKEIDKDLELYNKVPKEFKSLRRPDFRLEKNGKVLYINVDGLYMHSELVRKDKKYHLELLDLFLNNNQIILQFREDELRKTPTIVQSIISSKLGIFDRKIHARQCQIKKISNKEGNIFFKENHLMGSYKGSISTYGLFFKEELISIVSIGMQKDKNQIKINRFATKKFCTVRGGFSKLLKFLEKTYNPSEIVSYCDRRYTDGQSYIKSGFSLSSISLGWKWTDGKNTFNRLKCRANMDDRGLSQAEHAIELRWYKIYDAGQAKYVKKCNNG